jgi:hypothetical protein
MNSHQQFRVTFFPDGLPQTHRYHTREQAEAFIAKLKRETPGIRAYLEIRSAVIGPWTRVEPRGER